MRMIALGTRLLLYRAITDSTSKATFIAEMMSVHKNILSENSPTRFCLKYMHRSTTMTASPQS
ncbi:MAG: hypothetical protein LUC24_02555 [Bacteroidales bacterium]|nr:hypothetical protein [Bacteroidales bacterium]